MMARQAGWAIMLAVVTAGCAVPSQYLGIPTRGGMSAEEGAALQAALAEGELGTGDCLWWDKSAGARSRLPCSYIPNAVLAAMAWSDDKHAMLELGKRLEEGRGIAQDWDKAEALYRRAAQDTTAGTAVATNHGYEPVSWTSAVGLPEAAERLAALRARRRAR